MPKPWPEWKTDEEAEHFIATADLTEYDFSALRRVRFTFSPETGVTIHDVAADRPIDPSGGDTGPSSAQAIPAAVTKRRARAGGVRP